MDSNNLVQIIINFSQSLAPIQSLIMGLCYILGLCFVFIGLSHIYKISAQHHHGSGNEPMSVGFFYIIGGAVLLFFPSTFTVVSTTVFGSSSALQYAPPHPLDVVSAVILMIQTAGLIWFIRGCSLVVTSSEPGSEHGPKGLVFIFSGILAINIELTAATLSSLMGELQSIAITFKNFLGY